MRWARTSASSACSTTRPALCGSCAACSLPKCRPCRRCCATGRLPTTARCSASKCCNWSGNWTTSGARAACSSEVPSVVPSTSLMLTYPHRRYGTLPLSGRTRGFFPQGTSGVSMVTLVDGRWGTRYTGWVVHDGRYVAGLSKWMEDHQMPVGAFITLERTADGERGDRRLPHATRQARVGAYRPRRPGRQLRSFSK